VKKIGLMNHKVGCKPPSNFMQLIGMGANLKEFEGSFKQNDTRFNNYIFLFISSFKKPLCVFCNIFDL